MGNGCQGGAGAVEGGRGEVGAEGRRTAALEGSQPNRVCVGDDGDWERAARRACEAST